MLLLHWRFIFGVCICPFGTLAVVWLCSAKPGSAPPVSVCIIHSQMYSFLSLSISSRNLGSAKMATTITASKRLLLMLFYLYLALASSQDGWSIAVAEEPSGHCRIWFQNHGGQSPKAFLWVLCPVCVGWVQLEKWQFGRQTCWDSRVETQKSADGLILLDRMETLPVAQLGFPDASSELSWV